jgi:hypothetical protein
MKTFLAFILISASSLPALACGPYYPYGETVRFSLFKPNVFQTKGLNAYHFSSEAFGADPESVRLGEEQNCALWQKRAPGIPLSVIYDAVYHYGEGTENNPLPNKFMRTLIEQKDRQALDYLKFADQCSDFNTYYEDPWERSEHSSLPQRGQLIRKALKSAAKTNDPELSLRYAFLAIRMAFYNDDHQQIVQIYDRYFAGHATETIIDYWSLYFRAVIETDQVRQNFMAAQVFVHAPDKRFVVQMLYDKEIPVKQTLGLAKTADEKSAVWALAAVRNHGRAFDNLRNVEQLTPKSEMLSLLLLREVNKLEDWIYTPYYSEFEPSLSDVDDWNEPDPTLHGRVQKDRAYAQRLLDFVKTVEPAATENAQLWKSARIYLHFMVMDFGSSLDQIRELKTNGNVSRPIDEQLDVIRALCLNAQQPKDSAIILNEVKPVLLREYARGNDRFLFAIARELEYKGNTTDAAILLSKIGQSRYYDADFGGISEQYWKSRHGFQTLFYNVYYDYFFYLDAEYTPGEMKALISQVSAARPDNPFEHWKYREMKQEIPRLYDLLGTKYMRKNQLRNAHSAFKSVNDTLWKSDFYPYKTYLNANPFYTNMYNEHTATQADKIRYNKESLVHQLIEYLGKAENPKTEHRDYYYFLVANCQLNMTQYGNSWLMKRYFWSNAQSLTGLEDDGNFFYCDEAKKYYLKAKSVSKSTKFQALCLRMAGRCEKYKITYKLGQDDNYAYDPDEDVDAKIFAANKYYKQIRSEYPDDYEQLIGNCYSFDAYFETYKK